MTRQQRYVSNELTHFVGRTRDDAGRYDLLVKILQTGWLTHPPHEQRETRIQQLKVGIAQNICDDAMFRSQMICFCDIPVEDFDIHMAKYSNFGIAFEKSFLVDKGASPVFYVAKDSMVLGRSGLEGREDVYNDRAKRLMRLYLQAETTRFNQFCARWNLPDYGTSAFWQAFKALGDVAQAEYAALDEQKSEWFDVFSFVNGLLSYIKCFDSALSDDDEENFYMEREWRVIGNINFSLADVSRVVMPRAYAQRFRMDVPGYFGSIELL